MKYLFTASLTLLALPSFAFAEEIIDITFPVDGDATFSDDFDDQRAGHLHHATDIAAEKMTPVLAAVDGEITFAPSPEPSYGYMLTLEGDDGYEYNYVHLNNDTPGTDDGNGGAEYAYAEGIERGVRVERGQHIAWVGDSGNAESVSSHLHFEMYDDDTAINPYPSLLASYGVVVYDYSPEAEAAAATSISDDKDLDEADDVNCTLDTLIRTQDSSTVYYCGTDGGRYYFPNESTFFSWYDTFDDVEYVTTEVMASIPLKGLVTYKPGTSLVKLLSVPKVYAVAANGTLRWLTSDAMAETLYGEDWPTIVRDLSDGFFPAYDVGENIERVE